MPAGAPAKMPATVPRLLLATTTLLHTASIVFAVAIVLLAAILAVVSR